MTQILELFADNPALGFVVGAIVLLVVIWAAGSRGREKDPQRAFTAIQRSEGFARAGGRCEFKKFAFFRCGGNAEHGDHFFPWSRGGASSAENFVAACARCNLSKGARQPSVFVKHALERRRRRYFPAGVNTRAGAWYGGGR